LALLLERCCLLLWLLLLVRGVLADEWLLLGLAWS
jgi:hypothetical protein